MGSFLRYLLQRARGWCKRAWMRMDCRPGADSLNPVGESGTARYSGLSARFSGIQVVPRKSNFSP